MREHEDIPGGRAQDGFAKRSLTALRDGVPRPERDLDLHGMTEVQAHAAVLAFLDACAVEGVRCVRIIHGQGRGSARGPVLREGVYRWLRDDPRILAYCHAAPRLGGTGATHVLFRRKTR